MSQVTRPKTSWQLRAEAAERDLALQRGANEAAAERLREAERRVYSDPDKTFGCDAADHLAELILFMRSSRAHALREAVDFTARWAWKRWAETEYGLLTKSEVVEEAFAAYLASRDGGTAG